MQYFVCCVQLAGAAVAAVFLYFQLTQVDFVTETLGTPLVLIADCLMIAAGCLLILTAIIGLLSGCTQNTCCIASVRSNFTYACFLINLITLAFFSLISLQAFLISMRITEQLPEPYMC
jgi:hypothetical protein